MEDEVDVASYHEASSFKKALMERFNKEQGESHQSKPTISNLTFWAPLLHPGFNLSGATNSPLPPIHVFIR